MKFPGYWVSRSAGGVTLQQATFDDTDLDPATNWTQAWQNQDVASTYKGYVGFESALAFVAELLALDAGRTLTKIELDQAALFEPVWQGDRCEIRTLEQLLGNLGSGVAA